MWFSSKVIFKSPSTIKWLYTISRPYFSSVNRSYCSLCLTISWTSQLWHLKQLLIFLSPQQPSLPLSLAITGINPPQTFSKFTLEIKCDIRMISKIISFFILIIMAYFLWSQFPFLHVWKSRKQCIFDITHFSMSFIFHWDIHTRVLWLYLLTTKRNIW